MANYKITIAYDGTDYHGWQFQPGLKTIQGTIQESLERISGEKIKITGAGRTDAGVHAIAQIANFKADLTLKDEELHRALNATLPKDIRIINIERVPENFNALKMAKAKIYEYRILNSRTISPFLFRYVYYYPYPLDFDKMKEASKYFIGKKDFTSFSSSEIPNKVREVFYSNVFKKENEIIYEIKANGYLKYMVRTIVGTLLEVGTGKIEPKFIKEIFNKRNRAFAGQTAPPHGLYLKKVIY